MTNSPSIVPSETELRQWESLIFNGKEDVSTVLRQAFQAGADQELEACCEAVSHWYGDWVNGINLPIMLRTARRPKLPSLKEQACDALDAYVYGNPDHGDKQNTYNIIRQALEALPNA